MYLQRDFPSEFPDLPKLKWFGNMEPAYVTFILCKLREYVQKLTQVEATKELLLAYFSLNDTEVATPQNDQQPQQQQFHPQL